MKHGHNRGNFFCITVAIFFLLCFCSCSRWRGCFYFYQKSINIPIKKVCYLVDNFHTVERGALYRSRQLGPKKLTQYVKKYGIRTIVNLRGRNEFSSWWKKELSMADSLGVMFFNISMNSRVLTSKEDLIKLFTLYENAPKPILIHCFGGADRTGEAAALWVLDQQNKSKHKACKQFSMWFGYFKSRRPAKKFLIKLWKGRSWLENSYKPENYSKS
jgi:protein tyrosine phosphatase (PTP) superfamily phosphohydrolase (DUF442 family)